MRRWIFFMPLAILGILAFMAIGTLVVMLLWNWLMPPLFGWHLITFWQALGLLALGRIFFGGFGGGFFGPGVRERIADRMRDRMGHFTPEERERFRQRMRERWGFGEADQAEKT